MTAERGLKPKGAPERSPIAGGGAPLGVDGMTPKRYSVQRKMEVVARLLRGEPLDLVAREANVSVAKLTEWRERALAGAASALKERERDESTDDALRAGEDCRTTGGSDDGRLARSADPQSHAAVERHPRLCGRVRLYRRQGDGTHRSAARSHSS